MTMLADLPKEDEMTSSLPEAAVPMFRLMVSMLAELDVCIATLDREIAMRAKEDEQRKPRMLVSVALANKMARMVWALLTKNEDGEG